MNKAKYFDCFTTKRSAKAYRKDDKLRHKISTERDCAVSIPLTEKEAGEEQQEHSVKINNNHLEAETKQERAETAEAEQESLKSIIERFRYFISRQTMSQ